MGIEMLATDFKPKAMPFKLHNGYNIYIYI